MPDLTVGERRIRGSRSRRFSAASVSTACLRVHKSKTLQREWSARVLLEGPRGATDSEDLASSDADAGVVKFVATLDGP